MNKDESVNTTINNGYLLTWYFSAHFCVFSLAYATLWPPTPAQRTMSHYYKNGKTARIFGYKANICVLLLRPYLRPYSATVAHHQ